MVGLAKLGFHFCVGWQVLGPVRDLQARRNGERHPPGLGARVPGATAQGPGRVLTSCEGNGLEDCRDSHALSKSSNQRISSSKSGGLMLVVSGRYSQQIAVITRCTSVLEPACWAAGLHKQHKLGKPQILCFGAPFIGSSHGFPRASESSYR